MIRGCSYLSAWMLVPVVSGNCSVPGNQNGGSFVKRMCSSSVSHFPGLALSIFEVISFSFSSKLLLWTFFPLPIVELKVCDFIFK